MPEQELIEALEAKSQARIAAIDSEADDAVRAIHADAQSLINDLRRRMEADADEQFDAFRREERIREENQHRNRQRELRHRFVDSVFEQVQDRLTRVRERSDYADIWRRLSREALSQYRREQDAPAKVCVHPDDRLLARREGIPDGSIVDDVKLRSGVMLIDPAGRLRVVNTPESRFRKGREEFTKQIVEALRRESGL